MVYSVRNGTPLSAVQINDRALKNEGPTLELVSCTPCFTFWARALLVPVISCTPSFTFWAKALPVPVKVFPNKGFLLKRRLSKNAWRRPASCSGVVTSSGEEAASLPSSTSTGGLEPPFNRVVVFQSEEEEVVVVVVCEEEEKSRNLFSWEGRLSFVDSNKARRLEDLADKYLLANDLSFVVSKDEPSSFLVGSWVVP